MVAVGVEQVSYTHSHSEFAVEGILNLVEEI